jgi:hypothetical protein
MLITIHDAWEFFFYDGAREVRVLSKAEWQQHRWRDYR